MRVQLVLDSVCFFAEFPERVNVGDSFNSFSGFIKNLKVKVTKRQLKEIKEQDEQGICLAMYVSWYCDLVGIYQRVDLDYEF